MDSVSDEYQFIWVRRVPICRDCHAAKNTSEQREGDRAMMNLFIICFDTREADNERFAAGSSMETVG